LINDAGEQVTSQNYRGKPVVMIFYLGHGCSHCLEQLNAFAPVASEFAEAGISLVAVSTDSVEGLKKTFGGDKAAPFPLLSDAALDSFKAFRAYDDFEKAALHGTFLVDGQGLVRWQDINFEPFTNTTFLLAESTRLLKISEAQLMTKSGKKRKQLAWGRGEPGSER
jgi:peroxiredoxin